MTIVYLVLPLWDRLSNYPRVLEMLEHPRDNDFEPKVFTNRQDAEEYLQDVRKFEDLFLDEDHWNTQNILLEVDLVDSILVKSAPKK